MDGTSAMNEDVVPMKNMLIFQPAMLVFRGGLANGRSWPSQGVYFTKSCRGKQLTQLC